MLCYFPHEFPANLVTHLPLFFGGNRYILEIFLQQKDEYESVCVSF